MGAPPKYAAIFQKLHEGIQRRSYRPGDRLPSEVALRRRFQASRPTVAQALRELPQRLNLIELHVGAGSFVRRIASPERVYSVEIVDAQFAVWARRTRRFVSSVLSDTVSNYLARCV